MSKPTVARGDIELYEDSSDLEPTYASSPHTMWVAELIGRLSTGENVVTFRSADHAGEAPLRLEEAIRAQGWEIEE